MWDHRVPAHGEPFGPETLGPLDVAHVDAMKYGMRAGGRVDEGCGLWRMRGGLWRTRGGLSAGIKESEKEDKR
jgi:hypothetical protein